MSCFPFAEVTEEKYYGLNCGGEVGTEVKLTDTDGTPDVMNLAEIAIYGLPPKSKFKVVGGGDGLVALTSYGWIYPLLRRTRRARGSS